jgi:hypothetical protein
LDRKLFSNGRFRATDPNFPELKEWPYFWQQTEYVMGGEVTNSMFLVLVAKEVLK